MQKYYIQQVLQASVVNVCCSMLFQKDYETITVRAVAYTFLTSLFVFLKKSTFTRLSTLSELLLYEIPSVTTRFRAWYLLLSVEYNFRLAISINLLTDLLPSISSVYANANWSEREASEMYGVIFMNNPDLRRLLTDYGFRGFPMRKDFPLTGYLEVRYDDETARILYEPVQLTQEFRVFSLTSPWEHH